MANMILYTLKANETVIECVSGKGMPAHRRYGSADRLHGSNTQPRDDNE